MAREPASFTVSLYPSLAAFAAREAGVELVVSSRHQAVRRAAYALAGIAAPCDAPPGAWVAACCRACDGSWEKLMFGGFE